VIVSSSPRVDEHLNGSHALARSVRIDKDVMRSDIDGYYSFHIYFYILSSDSDQI
jgi:hypothetical protein